MSNKSLVIGPAWVGDMVMAQALYKALSRDSTSAQIHVVAPEWSRPLLARMPQVHKVFALNVAHGELGLAKRYRLARQLRSERYDQAIILPRSFKSALLPWFAGIAKRIGETGESRYGLINCRVPTNQDKRIANVCNYLRLIDLDVDVPTVCEHYIPELSVDIANQKRILDDNHIPAAQPLVACMVGAEFGLSKQWPVEHFAHLIDQLRERGINVCLLGSGKDEAVAGRIQALCAYDIFNLCGKTTLLEVIDLLAACNAAVSNDSGLMHIAAAVNTPVVAMYGATTPAYTPPLHDKAKSLYMKLECSPCWQRSCQYDHYRCLRDIMPQDVLKALLARM